MIELLDVTQHYGVRPVLRGISLRIERGEVVVILGPNGMGKTTLLGVMAGVLSPQQGAVLIDGMRRRGSEEEELAIRKMTVYLPDQPWLPRQRARVPPGRGPALRCRGRAVDGPRRSAPRSVRPVAEGG